MCASETCPHWGNCWHTILGSTIFIGTLGNSSPTVPQHVHTKQTYFIDKLFPLSVCTFTVRSPSNWLEILQPFLLCQEPSNKTLLPWHVRTTHLPLNWFGLGTRSDLQHCIMWSFCFSIPYVEIKFILWVGTTSRIYLVVETFTTYFLLWSEEFVLRRWCSFCWKQAHFSQFTNKKTGIHYTGGYKCSEALQVAETMKITILEQEAS